VTTPRRGSEIGRRRAAAQHGRRANYQQRRGEIIDAAAAVFKAKGYRGTSLADIAEQVGMDRATLYYYVGSKEELLDEVVTDVVKANLLAAEEIRDSCVPAPDKLRQLVLGLMVSFAEHYPFLYVYLQENLAHVTEHRQPWARAMRAVNRRYEQAVEGIIREGIEEGTIRPVGDPRVLA
jgi:AcrR family transcriptional regulator